MVLRLPLVLVEEVIMAEAMREAVAGETLPEELPCLEEAAEEAPGRMELRRKAQWLPAPQ
jgi:hypothetical protein